MPTSALASPIEVQRRAGANLPERMKTAAPASTPDQSVAIPHQGRGHQVLVSLNGISMTRGMLMPHPPLGPTVLSMPVKVAIDV